AALMKEARRSAVAEPQNASARGRLGMVLFAHQRESDAAVCFEQAAELNPRDARWPYLHGLILVASDRTRAMELLRRAIQIQPDIGAAHARLGELLLEDGQTIAAEAELQRALRQVPDDIRSLTALIRIALMQGNASQAKQRADEAIRLAPDLRVSHELLGAALQQLGKPDQAIQELKIAADLPEHSPEWHDAVAAEVMMLRRDTEWKFQNAQELFAAGDYSRGIRLLQDALTQDQSDPRIPCALGRALLEAGDAPAAMHVLQDAVQSHPDSAEVHFQMGVTQLLMKNLPAAQISLKTAIQFKPDYAMAWYNLGFVHEQQDQTDAALEAYGKSVSIRPSLIPGHLRAAQILIHRKNTDDAGLHIDAILRENPQNADALRLQALIRPQEGE
ncbi:MAG: tetratricopeptide repeat protein, partial [Planctomycetaceae bacterium]|nr:tetratricopeptide repeat protein [Planctomycetaceae bacterium]